MHVAKEIYFTKDKKKMIPYIRKSYFKNIGLSLDDEFLIVKNPKPFKKTLRYSHCTPTNSGYTYFFKDEDGVKYPMSQAEFNRYLQRHPLKFTKWMNYYQQGETYSIGIE